MPSQRNFDVCTKSLLLSIIMSADKTYDVHSARRETGVFVKILLDCPKGFNNEDSGPANDSGIIKLRIRRSRSRILSYDGETAEMSS